MANGDQQQQMPTADQAVAMMQYAYPGQSQDWYDSFRQNPSLAMGATYGGQSTQSANYGSQGLTGGSTGGQSSTALFNLMQAFGGGGQQQQQPQGQAPSSVRVPVSTDPVNAMTNLGAAALGMGAVYNPTPGQITSAKGGVSNVPSPVSTDAVPTVPTGPWTNTGSVFTPQGQAQANALWAQYGGSPSTDPARNAMAQQFYKGMIGQPARVAGLTPTAGLPPTSGGTPFPVTPANAAAAPGANTGAPTPWATAPAAPGISAPTIPQLSFANAHTSALADAGKALFAHYGGDPNSASPADIANFHTQLTGTIGQYTAGANLSPNIIGTRPTAPVGGPTPVGPPPGMTTVGLPAFGSAPVAPPAVTPPKRMAAGGFVDSRTPIGMAYGGDVPDVPDDQYYQSWNDPNFRAALAQRGRAAAEVRHAPITQPSGATQSTQPTQPTSALGTNAYQAPPGSSAMTVGQLGQPMSLGKLPMTVGELGSGPISGGGQTMSLGQLPPTTVGQLGSGPMPGAGQTMSLGQAPAAGGGIGGAIGGLASGLAAAAKTYADSIKPWQMQQSAPMPVSHTPAPQLAQQQLPQPQQRQLSPMYAAQYGYNPYLG